MQRMLAALKVMHDRNPSWGPLYVAHPGDLAAHRAWSPSARAPAMARQPLLVLRDRKRA
jgi:hypothetical protein